MIRLFVIAGVLLLLWSALFLWAVLEGWTRAEFAPENDPAQFMRNITEYIDGDGRGNVALTMIESGNVFDSLYRGPVGVDTLFPLASASKWITAIGIMGLVENDRISLDAPVETYLTRWTLPETEYDNRAVTPRRLLSHTAGLTDALGFGDYAQEENLPTLVESLNSPRASSDRPVRIEVGIEPGSEFKYSGGGYLILELLIEEVTGLPFEQYMQQSLFDPLGMDRTTYAPLYSVPDVAPAMTEEGESAYHYQYASSAATALASTPKDLTKLVQAILRESLPIAPSTLELMRQGEAFVLGAPIWGLGTMLYAPDDDDVYVFGHAGQNDPAINSEIRINPATGDAIIVLSTGNSSIATRVGFLWTFWQTGRPDFLGLSAEIQRAVPIYLVGVFLILAMSLGIALMRRR